MDINDKKCILLHWKKKHNWRENVQNDHVKVTEKSALKKNKKNVSSWVRVTTFTTAIVCVYIIIARFLSGLAGSTMEWLLSVAHVSGQKLPDLTEWNVTDFSSLYKRLSPDSCQENEPWTITSPWSVAAGCSHWSKEHSHNLLIALMSKKNGTFAGLCSRRD